jgi:hypothetical protein
MKTRSMVQKDNPNIVETPRNYVEFIPASVLSPETVHDNSSSFFECDTPEEPPDISNWTTKTLAMLRVISHTMDKMTNDADKLNTD